ncbi:hypothetical protein TWF225_008023 [Orbilia oligospora]|nr:hypothetical protein TWF751_006938 [Orbilia oligospora]KAF3177743.1 hypothetical protein TWF225_008023 [Orbilia oligospora]KAF3239852.1 hypothetical protein TWF217_001174 [Orbilia oligospora]KAF3280294.1 hypothetical protein TWF132_011853 [Orbilia oligospora]
MLRLGTDHLLNASLGHTPSPKPTFSKNSGTPLFRSLSELNIGCFMCTPPWLARRLGSGICGLLSLQSVVTVITIEGPPVRDMAWRRNNSDIR